MTLIITMTSQQKPVLFFSPRTHSPLSYSYRNKLRFAWGHGLHKNTLCENTQEHKEPDGRGCFLRIAWLLYRYKKKIFLKTSFHLFWIGLIALFKPYNFRCRHYLCQCDFLYRVVYLLAPSSRCSVKYNYTTNDFKKKQQQLITVFLCQALKSWWFFWWQLFFSLKNSIYSMQLFLHCSNKKQ